MNKQDLLIILGLMNAGLMMYRLITPATFGRVCATVAPTLGSYTLAIAPE